MSRDIGEADWKRFRGLHPDARSRYYAGALAKVRAVLSSQHTTDVERFTTLARLVDHQTHEGSHLFDDFRRSTAVFQLACWRSEGLVTDDEFATFTPETRSAIEQIQSLEALRAPA
ncbi:MAG: hypothetical protein K1X57_10925 [Gemmataceae bacterium]|nr:hypothetical protein [Gemmataceae bacterium]